MKKILKENLKALQDEIEKYGALEKGFTCELLNHIKPWILAEAVRSVATEFSIDLNTNNTNIQAMIVDKAVEIMDLDEFETIAPYFLGTSRLMEDEKDKQ